MDLVQDSKESSALVTINSSRSNSSYLILEARIRIGVSCNTVDIFSDEAKEKPVPPARDIDVFKVETTARVGSIATKNARRQKRVLYSDVFESDVVEGDEWLSITMWV